MVLDMLLFDADLLVYHGTLLVYCIPRIHVDALHAMAWHSACDVFGFWNMPYILHLSYRNVEYAITQLVYGVPHTHSQTSTHSNTATITFHIQV
jgi:hypothetical protein